MTYLQFFPWETLPFDHLKLFVYISSEQLSNIYSLLNLLRSSVMIENTNDKTNMRARAHDRTSARAHGRAGVWARTYTSKNFTDV